jgi:simple sugar transport system permease protein/ribose transport system permease protein
MDIGDHESGHMERKTRIILFLLDNLIWVILAILFIVNAFITPKFFTYRNVVNILYHSSILSMLVLGEGIVLATGKLDLSVESTLAFSPAIAVLLMTKWTPGMDPTFALFVTLLLGALVGYFNGYCVEHIGINAFLQGLSMLIILRGVILFLVPYAIFNLDKGFTFVGSAKVFGNIPVAVFVMLFTFLVFEFFFKKTRYGRYFFATGGNPRASYISGINTRGVTIGAFVLAGVLAAVAGLLAVGRQTSVSNQMGEGMVLLAFAGAILGGASLTGGRGTPVGMLGGALFLGTISNCLTLLGVNVFLVYAIQGVLIFLALLLDQTKTRIYAYLFQKERMSKLETAFAEEHGT